MFYTAALINESGFQNRHLSREFVGAERANSRTRTRAYIILLTPRVRKRWIV